MRAAALLVAAGILLARAGHAQEVIADVSLSPRYPTGSVALTRGTIYRIEVRPASVRIEIRLRTRFRNPPQRTFPAIVTPPGSTTFTIVPGTTGEYIIERVDSLSSADVRVVIDRAETGVATRAQVAVTRRQHLGLGLRLVGYSPFVDCDSSAGYFCSGSLGTAAAIGAKGAELCLAVVPLGVRSIRALGGCAVVAGWFDRGDRDFLTVGVAPRLRVMPRGAAGGLSVVGQLSFGRNTRPDAGATDYTFYSAGLVASPDGEGRFELEVSLVRVTVLHSRAKDTFLRIGLGAILHRRATALP